MEVINATFGSQSLLSASFATPWSSKDDIFTPYAISPYAVVTHLWYAVTGSNASEFEFTSGATPMSTLRETATALVLYYTVIFGGRELMRNRPAYKLNSVFIVHNFYLTAISGLLLAAFIQQLAPGLWRNGLYDGICGGTGWTQPLVVLYYLNYLTKYLELLDTVFLVLKKKPLSKLILPRRLSSLCTDSEELFSIHTIMGPLQHSAILNFWDTLLSHGFQLH